MNNRNESPGISYRFSQEFLIHLSTWMFLFGLPLMLIGRADEPTEFGRIIRLAGPPLAMALTFYLNYLWLVPQWLFRRRYKAYIAVNVGLCLCMLAFVYLWFSMCRTCFPYHSMPRLCAPPDTGLFIFFRIRDFILFAFMAVLAVVIRMGKKWYAMEQGRQKTELQRREAELKNLRNQISPHFLLNTLNNIYALIDIDTNKAQQAVQDLSSLLRHLLNDNILDFIPLHRELDFLENYVALMKIRIPEEVDLRFCIDLPQNNNMQIAPLIFISLIENAFKHGISPMHPCFIHIRIFSERPDSLTCLIENSNYPKQSDSISGSGIGLEQVQKRLDLIYPDRYEWTRGTNADQSVYTSKLTLQTSKQ